MTRKRPQSVKHLKTLTSIRATTKEWLKTASTPFLMHSLTGHVAKMPKCKCPQFVIAFYVVTPYSAEGIPERITAQEIQRLTDLLAEHIPPSQYEHTEINFLVLYRGMENSVESKLGRYIGPGKPKMSRLVMGRDDVVITASSWRVTRYDF